jgi:cytochrome P450
LSFSFKTGPAARGTLWAMNTEPTCPFHARSTQAPLATPAPEGAWPPGPRGLTGWSLLTAMSRDLLGSLAGWQREFGDVVHLRIWPEHEVMLTDPQLARELLLTHHESLVRWERGARVFGKLQGNGVLVAEGEAWRRKRHALQPAFSAASVHAFVPAIAAAADQALARWPAEAGDWPIESALTALAMDVILRMLFSSEVGEDARRAEDAVQTVVAAANASMYWPATWPAWVPWKRAERQAQAWLDCFIRRHIDARVNLPQQAWPEDLLTALLRLHRADPLAWPLQAVRDECMTIFQAGHETSAATLTWWAWCMAAHPQAQRSAREEVQRVLQGRAPAAADVRSLPFVTQTLQETLRLYPASPILFTRRSKAPLALGGWRLPAGTMFVLPVHLMQRDARWFAQPLSFRPERFGRDAPEFPRGAWQPFGAGPRACLGQHLAMTEMTVIAASLLQRFTLAVPEGAAVPQPVMKLSLRPAQRLRLRVEPCVQED